MRASIRSATAADYPAFSFLFEQLGLEERTPSADRWTSELMFHTLVAEHAGAVRGYVSFYRLGKLGHVRNLVVSRDARGLGVGKLLMQATAKALRAAGASEWHLNVKANNVAAIRLYEGLGMRAEHRSTVLRMTWDAIAAMPVELVAIAPLGTEEDDDIERAFDMPSGRIAMARRPERVLVQARDRTCAVAGCAVFDGDVVSPFRAKSAAIAARLLGALHSHSRTDAIQIVIENDDALSAEFIGAGANARLQLLHYSGPLVDTMAA